MNAKLWLNKRRVAMHRNGLATFVLLCGLLLSACTPAPPSSPWPVWEDERIIPFQTIDVDSDARSSLPEFVGIPEIEERFDPGMLLPEESIPTVSRLHKIESVDDVEPLVGLLPPATIDYLRNVDYDAYIVFALLRGQRGSGGFPVFIERIAAGKGGVRVYAQFRIPAEGTAISEGYTFPYHVVKVKLSDLAWHNWIAFDLLTRLCDDDKHPC